ncbi:MAG: hypothetical protein HY597_00955 [Candidatus Omnitrophica bacterium]|nr:hypothetical protein [Candidatus Omnitrophota bacterium]
MKLALLNLISTPAAVLPSLGLRLRMGLSSEDPMVGRHPSEPYDAYLSVYAPDGRFVNRLALGRIPPHCRQMFDIDALVEPLRLGGDHLVIMHRVPASLADRYGVIDQPVELPDDTDYIMFRAYVQYSYPHGGGAHGGVIYEIPPRQNESMPGKSPSQTLTFTTKAVCSDTVETHVLLLNCSTNPRYATTAVYRFALYTCGGEQVASGACPIAPFTHGRLDLRRHLPAETIGRELDPLDGLAHFSFHGFCEEASVPVLVLNLSPTMGGVSVEHTHPPQGYMIAFTPQDRQRVKQAAVASWRSLLDAVPAGR